MTKDHSEKPAGVDLGVVVVNQHGDNRGDEAAMRAMITQLAKRFPGHDFTIIHQFSDPLSEVELDVPVDYIDIRLPVLEALRLGLFALLTFFHARAHWLLGRDGRDVVSRYESARLVISAPGGPYFGDTYADHEIVHWFYVWLGHRMSKPLYLYAPSVGPFENLALNPLRRRGFRWFDAIALRDEVSARYLTELLGKETEFEVTADSALQDASTGAPARERGFVLAVSVRDPGPEARTQYETSVLRAIAAVCERHETDIVFLPQLHGPRHDDQPYLEGIAQRIEGARSVRVESSDDLDSHAHRRTIADADVVIAGRYHPAVFSVAEATPALVIPYEHKSWGVARQAGIERWTVDLSDAKGDRLEVVMRDLLERIKEVEAILESHRDALHHRALRTSEIAFDVANRS